MAVTDEAIEKIKGMIVSGTLRPGDRLPKEASSPPTSGLSGTPCGGGARALADPHPGRTAGRRHVHHHLDPQLLLEALSFIINSTGTTRCSSSSPCAGSWSPPRRRWPHRGSASSNCTP